MDQSSRHRKVSRLAAPGSHELLKANPPALRAETRPGKYDIGMLRTVIGAHPAVKAVLPAGSRRRATVAGAVHRLWPAPQLHAEETKLRGTWAGYRQDMLGRYLVSGYQDPRINVQSILARHMLVRA
ncbi:MAG: hypothetical protein J2P34_10910, partial [Actinobacteria bacterium]|nr:hypothetical protein [Actinomycetota bacterium]